VEESPREWRFYVDAQVAHPVFQDRGRRLVSARSDPNAVRDMTAIAAHRGWRLVEATGAASFRREAWIAGRTLGLEVRGYAPTERDLQELDRRRANRERMEARLSDLARPPANRGDRLDRAADRLKVVEAVVRARIVEPAAQDRLLSRARARVADWLEQGARFDRLTPHARGAVKDAETTERRRAR
jgi:Large polyvalent protein-associated domain 7